MAGWLGLIFTAGIVWIVAMIWAQTKPTQMVQPSEDVNALKARIVDLETRLASPMEVSS
jgi:hypothetical protein